MTTQPTFWGHANTSARQGVIWDEGPHESGLSCAVCGEPLVATQSGFLSCPNGHGKLFEAANLPENWAFGDELDAEV